VVEGRVDLVSDLLLAVRAEYAEGRLVEEVVGTVRL